MCSFRLAAQEYITDIRAFSVEDGLSSNLIHEYLEDQRGFVWIATVKGINCFDGENFKVFFEEDTKEHSSFCNGIREDVDGNIWIKFWEKRSTHVGQNFFKIIDKNFKIHDTAVLMGDKMPFKMEEIIQIQQLADNILIFLLNGNRLYKYDGEFKFITKVEESEPVYIASKRISDGSFYLTLSKKIIRMNDQGDIIDEWPNNTISFSHMINRGTKITKPDFFNGAFDRYTFSKEDLSIIEPFFQEKIWFEKIKHKERLQFSWIYEELERRLLVRANNFAALFDSQGNLIIDFTPYVLKKQDYLFVSAHFLRKNQFWYADGSSLFILNYKKNKFESFGIEQPKLTTRGISQTEDGRILVNTSKGFHQYDKEHQLINNFKNKFADHNHYEWKPNEVLITEGRGQLFQLDLESGKEKHYYSIQKDFQQYNNQVGICIFESSRNNMYMGFSDGLMTFNSTLDSLRLYQKVNEFEEIKQANINFIKEFEEGIWLATDNGLYLLSETEGVKEHFEPLPDLNIWHFYREGDVFWLATYGQGLVKWNNKTNEVQQFKKKDGLLSLYLLAVYPDEENNLWLSTEHGIARLNKMTERVNVYLIKDGITNNEFNRSSHHQAKDGKIYFGGLDGVTTFYPKDLNDAEVDSVKFAITKYATLNPLNGEYEDKITEYYADRKIVLPPSINSFKISFNLLDYESVQQKQFSYKIDGRQENWVVQNENFIKINQFPPGNYVLRIKAKGNDGIWTRDELVVPIEIEGYFYQKLGWQIFGIALLISLALLVYQWRIRQIKNREKTLEVMVKNRTNTIRQQNEKLNHLNEDLSLLNQTKDRLFAILAHDLRNPVLSFQSIVSSINYLAKRNQPERILDLGHHIEKEANQLYHLLDNLLNWALSQRGDLELSITFINLHELAKKLIEDNKNIASSTNISLLSEVSAGEQVLADSKILETILRNLISNAFRYTDNGGWIKISIAEEKDFTVIKVADNGAGINKNEIADLFNVKRRTDAPGEGGARFSIGLHLCKELIELMKGKIRVESMHGKGTEFEILLPKQFG